MKTMIATLLQERLRMCGMLAAFAAATGLLSAQSPAARIASEVNGSEPIALKGSLLPLANPANDAGRVPAGTRFNGITMMFSRSAAQEADLDALLAAQQDPHSPQYHQWLTSDQFAARYGTAQADLDKASSWLEQQGFTVDSVNRSRNAIHFSGSAGQVESAFQTQMHYYTTSGEKHFAPSTELSIPAALAPVVSGIRNLTDIRPRPQHTLPHAGFTSGVSGGVFFAPPDIVTAYDINPLYTGGVNGAGQTIAIMGQSYVKLSDIEAFQAAAGLTKKDPALILVPGTGNDGTFSTGDEGESDLDLEWSSAIAPGANVVLVYTGSASNSGGVYTSAQYAVDEMIGTIISISYSTCETDLAAAGLTQLDPIFKQAAAQGQTVLAASGDSGSTACSGDTALTAAQQEAITVNYPASSAYVTGVGGTAIQAIDGVDPSTGTKGANFSTYWNSNYNGTSNVANDLVNSLKQYIPEVVWNDDSSGNLASTGGGTSALVLRPTWQTGVPGIPSGAQRLVPDIAFYSSPDLPGYLFCTSDTSSWNTTSPPLQTGSCGSGFRGSTSDNSLTLAGGTSFATPIFAGMVALLNQKLNYTEGQGLINPTLYQLAAVSSNYTSGAIHDVTSGNNNCGAGATLCGTTTGGFSANAGYDEVTGIGSLDLAKIAAVWPTNSKSTATLIGTNTTVSDSNSAPAVGASVTFTITVASTSGATTPTGSVTLQVDGGPTFGGTTVAAQPISSNGTLTYSTSFAAAGPHQVLAQYAGDTTHAPSVGAATVSIASVSSGKGTFALAATNVTVSQGSSGNSTITVTPSGGYLGTVDLTFTTSNNTALTNLCYNFTTILANGTGTVVVPGTAAVTTQLTLDTLPADCGALIKGKGNHAFKAMHAQGGTTRSDNRRPGTGSLPAGIALGGLLLAGFLARGSRRLRGLACVIALGAVAMAVTACGGGGSSSTTATPDPPKGTYTVTVTGTDSVTSTITGTTTFTFTID